MHTNNTKSHNPNRLPDTPRLKHLHQAPSHALRQHPLKAQPPMLSPLPRPCGQHARELAPVFLRLRRGIIITGNDAAVPALAQEVEGQFTKAGFLEEVHEVGAGGGEETEVGTHVWEGEVEM